MITEITEYLNSVDLDFRKAKGVKFYDQKITPDVLSIMADCILNLVADRKHFEFTWKDIYESNYFNQNVKSIFKKPDAKNKKAKNEYDKFIGQPLVTLGYAKILNAKKVKGKNYYSISNKTILEFISHKERNALIFLELYIKKVLLDSAQLKHFENFKKNNTKQQFSILKDFFIKFFLGNSNLGSRGSSDPTVEIRRIFNKILNIYAHSENIKGQIKGFFSENEIGFYDLMYNRPNWRDKDKSKRITRKEAKDLESEENLEKETAYSNYMVQKAMNMIRKMYSESEVKDQWANGEATQVHHIFPKSEFPQLAHYIENLIKLTPTQHFTKAHPKNKTDEVSKDYQLICLLSKSDSIEKSLKKNEMYYRKESFVYCINTGLSQDLKTDITFKEIKTELTTIYNAS